MILVAEEAISTPKIEKIVFPGKLLGNFNDIKEKVSQIPFYSSTLENNELTIVRVESRNIKKMPYLFYIVLVDPDKLTVLYSVPQDASESLRRSTILKHLTSLISIIADHYNVDEGIFSQYIDSTLDKLLNSLSQTYSTIFNKYESLVNEYREIKRSNLELTSSNRNLTIQASQLTSENKILAEQLKRLQAYSDEALMSLVEDWIEVHNNTIDLDEFSKTYKLSPPRVEEILDRMVSMGYLELRT